MQRYFITNDKIQNNYIYINDEDYHHIKNVMRMRVGDHACFIDEDENIYYGQVSEFTNKVVKFKINEITTINTELNVDVTIAHGLVARNKQEEVIRRITELGANSYLPVLMTRSVIKVKTKTNPRQDRLEKIVKHASEQSERTKLLNVLDIKSFSELLDFSNNFDLKLYAYEKTGRNNQATLKSVLSEFNKQSILALVGPEGGFTDEEANLLDDAGFIAIGLGKRILRTETAPLYIMSAISYQLELGENNES